MPEMHDPSLTQLIDDARNGDAAARERFFEAVYPELRAIAARLRRKEHGPVTTVDGLVHESIARLLGGRIDRVEDAEAFRRLFVAELQRVLVDAARRRHALKRGAGHKPVQLQESLDAAPDAHKPPAHGNTTIDHVFESLDATDRDIWRLKGRGLTNAQIADQVGVHVATVERRLAGIRAKFDRE